MAKRGRKPLSESEKQDRLYKKYLKMYFERKEKYKHNLKEPLTKNTYIETLKDYREAGAPRPNSAILKDQLIKTERQAKTQQRNLKRNIKEWLKDKSNLNEEKRKIIDLYNEAKSKNKVNFFRTDELTYKLISYIDEMEAWKLAYGS